MSFCAALWLGLAPAQAGERELLVTVQPVYALSYLSDHVAHGVGAAAQVSYGLTDTWALQVLGGVTTQPGEPGTSLLWHASAGVVYALDVVRVVPYFEAAVGIAGLATDAGAGPNLGALVGLGADYEINRRWSVGLGLRYQAYLTDLGRVPVDFTVGPRATVHFGF